MAHVRLKIRDEDKGSGWQPVIASNGTPYWYKFTGGNRFNNGFQVFKADGSSDDFEVSLSPSTKDDYTLLEFYHDNDPHDQLSCDFEDDGKLATVTDSCSAACLNMIYGFVVCPEGQTGIRFLCHPRINNEL